MPASMQRTDPPASSMVGTASGNSRAERQRRADAAQLFTDAYLPRSLA